MANEDHPINSMMSVTLEKIRQMTDSNTIIGNPISTADGTTILPVSRVSFGFGSGGSEFASSKVPRDLFGGGSGAGVSITPVAFLVLKDGNVRLLQLAERYSGTADRALNMLPELFDTISGFVKKKDGDTSSETKQAQQPEQAAQAEQAEPVFEETVIIEGD